MVGFFMGVVGPTLTLLLEVDSDVFLAVIAGVIAGLLLAVSGVHHLWKKKQVHPQAAMEMHQLNSDVLVNVH
jgi:ABC-type methionine transport system permease subunit